jgi:hypothetical protein
MIVGMLNAVLTTETENWDRGMGRAGQGVSALRSHVNSNATGISDALNNMGQLSGLGGAISGAFGKVASTVGMMKAIVVGTTNAITSAALTLASPFTFAASKIYGAFASIASFVGRPLLIVVSAISINAFLNGMAKLASIAVKPITIPVSFAWGAITSAAGQAGAALVTAFGESWQAITSISASAIAGLGKFLVTAAGGLLGFLSGMAMSIGAAIAEPLLSLGSKVAGALIGWVGTAAAALPGMLAGFLGPFMTFSSAVTAIGIDVAKTFMMMVPELAFLGANVMHLAPMFVMTFEQIGGATVEFAAATLRVLSVLGPGLVDIFASAFPAIAATIGTAWRVAMAGVVEVVTFFRAAGAVAVEAVSELASGIVSFLGTAWKIVSIEIRAFANVAGEVFSAVGAGVGKLATVVTSGLGDLFIFLGGLIANIPMAGLSIAIGTVAVLALTGAVSGLIAAWGALGSLVSLPFAAIGMLATGILPLLGSMAALAGSAVVAFAGFAIVPGIMLAATAAAAGLAVGLWNMASAGAQSISEISKLSRELGISTTAMAGLAMGGGAEGGFTHGLLHMQRGIEDMSAHALQALAKINLDPAQLRGQSADAQLRLITDGFSRLTDHGQQASVALALFGRAGYEMMDTLARGTAGLDRMAVTAQRFGLTFTESQAAAIRSANREWAGFGQAMEGIKRQAAVLFAPLWEWIGKIGGQVGEWLVGKFRDFASVAQAALPDIQRVAMNLWTSIQEGIGQATTWMQDLGTSWGLTWNSISDVALYALATVIVAFNNLPRTWSIITDTLQLGWLTFLQRIRSPLASAMGTVTGVWDALPSIWESMTLKLEAIWLRFWAKTKQGAIEGALTLEGITNPETWLRAGAAALANADNSGLSAYERIQRSSAGIVRQMGIGAAEEIDAWIADMEAGTSDIAGRIRQNINRNSGQFNIDLFPNAERDIEALRARINGLPMIGNQFIGIGAALAGQFDGLGDALAAQFNGIGGALGGQFAAALDDAQRMFNQWQANARRGVNQIAAQATNLGINVNMTRAVTGHEAALAGSERAFSLLYNRGGTENYFQRLQLERQTEIRDLERQQLAALNRAPVIRRANF